MIVQLALYIVISFLCAALTTCIIMPPLLRMCKTKNLYDKTGGRKVHKGNIPRLGGVVFVPSVAIGVAASLLLLLREDMISETIKASTLLIACGIMLIYFTGLLDDIFGLSARTKLLVQVVAAMTFPFVGLYIDNLNGLFGIYELPLWASYVLTTFTVVLIVNSINLIDGIDGLASAITIIALSVFTYHFYIIHNYIFVIFSAALIGTLIVFMYYNVFGSTAAGKKTFMGDSGSLMLGFSLAYLSLKLSMHNARIPVPEEGILIPLSVLIIPIMDLARVAICRMWNGKSPFHPDKTHLHHLLLRHTSSQHVTLSIIIVADLLIFILNIACYKLMFGLTFIILLDIILYLLSVAWLKFKASK